MADRAEQQTRTFVKKVGDETLTRSITSARAEVEARFDGYFPEDEVAPKSGKSSSGGGGSRSGNAANSGGGSNASSAS